MLHPDMEKHLKRFQEIKQERDDLHERLRKMDERNALVLYILVGMVVGIAVFIVTH